MEAQMFDAEVFRERLTVAKGNRSWAEYARDAGVSKQRISQLVNKTNNAVPSVATIRKLAMAAQNDITLMDLAEAVGYLPEDLTKTNKNQSEKEKRLEMNEDRRNEMAEEDLLNGIRELTSNWNYYQSIDDFLGDYRLLYECEESTFDIGEPLQSENVSGEPVLTYPITATWTTNKTVNEIPFLIFAMKKSGSNRNLLVFGCTFSAQKMHELSLLPESILKALKGEDLSDYDPAHIIRDKRPATEIDKVNHLFYEMFSGERNGYFPKTYEGFGFRLAEYRNGERINLISEETLRNFVRKHSNVYLLNRIGKVFYHEFVEEEKSIKEINESTVPEMNDYIEKVTGYDIISQVISTELDCDVVMLDGEESSETNPPVVMAVIENVIYSGFQEKTLKMAMKKYAKELGLKRYGRQYYTENHPRLDVDEFSTAGKE